MLRGLLALVSTVLAVLKLASVVAVTWFAILTPVVLALVLTAWRGVQK